MNDVHFSSKTVEWSTPQDFFDKLNEEFHFTLDPCAAPENAKCEKFYTVQQNGLAKDWAGERVFCNPPYSRELPRWIQKCATSNAEVVVMLIPARTDTAAWHAYIFGNPQAEVRFIKGRVKFGGVSPTRHSHPRSLCLETKDAPFPCAVVIFRKTPQVDKEG